MGEGIRISHRNEDSDLPAAFNYTLEQQGLGACTRPLRASVLGRGVGLSCVENERERWRMLDRES